MQVVHCLLECLEAEDIPKWNRLYRNKPTKLVIGSNSGVSSSCSAGQLLLGEMVSSAIFVDLFLHFLKKFIVFDGKADCVVKRG